MGIGNKHIAFCLPLEVGSSGLRLHHGTMGIRGSRSCAAVFYTLDQANKNKRETIFSDKKDDLCPSFNAKLPVGLVKLSIL